MRAPRIGDDEENRFGRRNEGRGAPAHRYVYFIEASALGMVKIGCADDARKRLAQLQVGCPDELVLRGVFKTDDARWLEERYHEAFGHLRVRGEWFTIDDQLRSLMDDAFEPEECFCSIDFHPEKHRPGLATIHWQEGDDPKSFSARVVKVGQALGFPWELDVGAG